MLRWLAISALFVSSPVTADTFGGFSGVATPYLVDQDRVCEPLQVVDGRATGAPTCTRSPADGVAKLAFKAGTAQQGKAALITAAVAGQELVVSRSGQPIIAWRTIDPILKVIDIYVSSAGDRIAVVFATRRLGKDVASVIAFAVKTTERAGTLDRAVPTPKPASTPKEDPMLAQRIAAARSAPKRQAFAAWRHVLEHAPDHSEALYHSAQLSLRAKRSADAIEALQRLARSPRGDAIEWLVEARFDPAFSSVRGDEAYRAAVGLDRKPRTHYERLMGFGGRWEQVATCGEKPSVLLTTRRDRTFSLTVTVHCHGVRDRQTFAGTWRIDPNPTPHRGSAGGGIVPDGSGTPTGGQVILILPPAKGEVATKTDECFCVFAQTGDEEALHCTLGEDLDFEVLPTRR